MIVVTCDWCGRPIEKREPRIDLESDSRFTPKGAWKPGWLGHFHNTAECYGQVVEPLRALIEARAALEAIPTLDEEPRIVIAEPCPPVIDDAGAAAWCETRDRNREIAGRPGGIDELGLPLGVWGPLITAGIVTVAELRRRRQDGALDRVSGLGRTRIQTIDRFLLTPAEREFRDLLDNVGYRCRHALPRAGVRTLEDVAQLTDAEMLGIEGVGEKTVQFLRTEIASRSRALRA